MFSPLPFIFFISLNLFFYISRHELGREMETLARVVNSFFI
jgi:hypothetical protein